MGNAGAISDPVEDLSSNEKKKNEWNYEENEDESDLYGNDVEPFTPQEYQEEGPNIEDACEQKNLVVVGFNDVGKSELIKNYLGKGVVGVPYLKFGEFYVKDLKMDSIKIWDVNGTTEMKTVNSFLGSIHGVMVVFDLTNPNSFEKAKDWVDEIKSHLKPKDIPLVIVGNKCDLNDERKVSLEEMQKFTKEKSIITLEASGKIGSNVEDCFSLLIQMMDVI